ncbi:MAG: alpha/beta hydrolase [Candidatus Binatia bacterium]
MFRRTFQTSDGVFLSVLEAGRDHDADCAKPVLVFTPGWCMPASLWTKQLEELGQAYYTLALDPRGQGESEVPAFGYTAERRATDLAELLQSLANVVLIGWSLGAIESLQYVHMFGGQRLGGLVLVDSSVGEEPAPPASETFKQRLHEERDHTLEEFVRGIFGQPCSEAAIDILLRGAKQMSLNDSLSLLSFPFERSHWKRIAYSFNKPLLYVVTPQFEEQARNLQKNRPATQIEVFKTAGHALFVDEPERFNALIESFVRRLATVPMD